ncbi:hypothetical protein [Aeromonas sp. MrichA-1]|uniref:hypothetical protein n=1 Tax=Aeromonas sp. MrichA-1 TaxID=2823362 RepID=UPI001B32EAD5|nr:hypothetical protein [Aeromonas sp. MrichA-1]MBP4081357.1 hypothetical protein [Aeromonas sp. MrichA-1]
MELMEMQKKLAGYAKEMGLGNISLDELISSHRELRARNIQSLAGLTEEIKQARQQSAELTAKELAAKGWLSIESLKEMTFGEIVEMIESAD